MRSNLPEHEEQVAQTGESVEELKALVEGYKRILLLTVPINPAGLRALRQNYWNYARALLIEACIRLALILTLCFLVGSKAGLSGRVLVFLTSAVVLYAFLESVQVLGRLELFRRAFK